MRLKIIVIFFVLFFFLSFSRVFAGGFQIKSIGALDMDGVTVSHIWYSSGNPTITGIAPAYSDINIKVDGVDQKVSADSSGNWIFHPNLTDGDHTLVFTNNGGTISKTLTIGKNFPDNIGLPPKSETPTVGTITPTIILIALGTFLIITSPISLLRKK